MTVVEDEGNATVARANIQASTENCLASSLRATERACALRPYVTFLTKQEDRERIHRWIDYLCTVDEPESLTANNTKKTCLERLEKMLSEGKLGDPFLMEPPSCQVPMTVQSQVRNFSSTIATRSEGGNSPSPTADICQRLVALSSEAKTALRLAEPASAVVAEASWMMNREDDDVESLLSGPSSSLLPLQMREAQFHSKLLNIQSEHQTEIEELLWEKNRELEDLKNSFHKELQSVASKRLEKEIQFSEMEKERELVSRDAESTMSSLRSELKRTADANHEKQMERLRELIAEHQVERQRCKEDHREVLMKIGADVESRLKQIEDDYCQRISTQGEQIKELQASLRKCETRFQKMTREHECLEEEREHMERREKEANKGLSNMKAKLSTLVNRQQHLEETTEKERVEVEEEFRQLIETERSDQASSSRAAADAKERLTADLFAAKERIVTLEEANAAVMREGVDTHRRILEELRLSFETRLSDTSRRHEIAAAMLRDKLTNRVDESQCAAAELARVELELEAVRQRTQEEIARLQARCTMESTRQLDAVRNDLETLQKDLSSCERGRERQRGEADAVLKAERGRWMAEEDQERSRVERERAALRVRAAREMEEVRLHHEEELHEAADALSQDVAAADDQGAQRHRACGQRLAELVEEERRCRQALEAAREGRREALLGLGRDRSEEMARRRREAVAEVEAERRGAQEAAEEAQRRWKEERASVEVQFNKAVEEMAVRHSSRMREAISLTSRLDDCVRGLVAINQSLNQRLQEVFHAAARGRPRS